MPNVSARFFPVFKTDTDEQESKTKFTIAQEFIQAVHEVFTNNKIAIPSHVPVEFSDFYGIAGKMVEPGGSDTSMGAPKAFITFQYIKGGLTDELVDKVCAELTERAARILDMDPNLITVGLDIRDGRTFFRGGKRVEEIKPPQ